MNKQDTTVRALVELTRVTSKKENEHVRHNHSSPFTIEGTWQRMTHESGSISLTTTNVNGPAPIENVSITNDRHITDTTTDAPN
jgi:hypothetical protein